MSVIMIKNVKVETEYDPKPTPYRGDDWLVCDDNYDGAPDSNNRHMVGAGRTEKEAVKNYLYMFEDYYGIEISEKEREQILSQLGDE